MIFIDLTLDDDEEENNARTTKNPKNIQLRAKNNRKISRATRLEWLKRVKRKDSSKPVVATSVAKSTGNRVEIADAHSTNNCERVDDFIKKVMTSESEKSIQRDGNLSSALPILPPDNKDSTINQTVDSTVAMDLENSSVPLAAWLQSLQANCFDSLAPMEKRSSGKYPEASFLPLYQNCSLSTDLPLEKCPESFDLGITEEPIISSRVSQYDNIFDSIFNGDLSILDDQAILEDSLTAKSTNADLNCLIDFHLPSIDSPVDDSNYSSVRIVDPRLTRKTIGVKDPSLSDGISVPPTVSSIRKKDSLLNGAKDQLSFPSRSFGDVEATSECSENAIGDRFDLGNDYTYSNRRDLFNLPLLDHSESIMELADNDAMPEDDAFPGEPLIANSNKLKDYETLEEDAVIKTTNLPKIVNPMRKNDRDFVERTISTKHALETNLKICDESQIVQEMESATNATISNVENLGQSSSLSNVSSTTAYHEYLARQSSLTLRESSLEIPEGSQQSQHYYRLRKSDKLPVKMIQVAQVSSPKNVTVRRKLSPRAMENYEPHEQTTFGRSFDYGEDYSAVKRRKEDSGKRS